MMDSHTFQLTTSMHSQIKEMHSLVDASTDREILINGLLTVVDWDTIKEEDYILLEALRKTCKEFRVNLEIDEQFVKELKRKFYEKFNETLKEKIRAKRDELLDVPTKQLYYLAATAFANYILNRPAPASLIFEVLRCAGMEEERNFPNRYYFLEQLEMKSFVKKVKIVNSSKEEQLYCPTEKGWKAINGTEVFNKLIELKEKILSDGNVKKLMRKYSKDEIELKKEIPALLRSGKVISESENSVKVMLYNGKTFINLSKKEIEEIDSTAKSLGKFTQTELTKAVNADFKVRAYLIYAYEKGLVDVVERQGTKFIYERKG